MPWERTGSLKYGTYMEHRPSLEQNQSPKHAILTPKLSGKTFDPVTFDILQVDPEEYAGQLTLLDIKVFKAIKPEVRFKPSNLL